MNTIYQLKLLDRSKGNFINNDFDEAVIAALKKFIEDKENSAIFESFWYHYDTIYFFGMDASAMQHRIIAASVILGIRLYSALKKIPEIEMSFATFENAKALKAMCRARAEVIYEAHVDAIDKRTLFGEAFVLPFEKLPEQLQVGILIVASTADQTKYRSQVDEAEFDKLFAS